MSKAKKAKSDNVAVDMVEVVVEDEVKAIEAEAADLTPTDPKWVDHIIDQLSDHELIKGNPTTDGIRRVTEKVFGEILVSDSNVINESPQKVSVKHTLHIRKYDGGQEIIVSACVDVVKAHLPAPFNYHLVSTACTRAEGKALRRALKIRIHTAEEMANTDDNSVEADAGYINDQQILAIKTMCKRLDVNLEALAKGVCLEKVKSVKKIPHKFARVMIDNLSHYVREGVPEEYQGYNGEWEITFGG